ncbi:MAG: acyloxyacyl hydrolase [Syntrophaceae bacterium]|nr:acyloxyacyl hydrolase [Syntrophaceae bacterium]
MIMFNKMNLWICLCGMIGTLLLVIPIPVCADEIGTLHANALPVTQQKSLTPNGKNIWVDDIGEGFRSGTQVVSISVGGAYGVIIFGGEERHHLVLLSCSYGRLIGGVKGADSWYRGNWEVRGEVFGGAQLNSEDEGIVGITPHIRYYFATGTHFIPYLDVGAGITLTDIRAPDLGGAFQFNLQASAGVNYFIRDNVAVHLEVRYLHISSAAIYEPNNGVNSVGGFLGVSKYF